MEKIWKWINYNRYIVIAPLVGLAIWIAAVGCQPTTESPIRPGVFVNARELTADFRSGNFNKKR